MGRAARLKESQGYGQQNETRYEIAITTDRTADGPNTAIINGMP